MLIFSHDPQTTRKRVAVFALPSSLKLPTGTVTCPKCGSTQDQQVSKYLDTDYFCGRCTMWYGKSDMQMSTGDALERLGNASCNT